LEALAGRVTDHDDAEIRQPDGTVVPIQIWGTPVVGPDGVVEYAITAFADVSDRVRGRGAAGQRGAIPDLGGGPARRVRCLLGDPRQPGAIADFRYEYINDAGCRLDQRSREDTVGHTIAELFPGTVTSGILVARIVGRQGGRVWADGRVGDGACFSFTLPAASTEKGEAP
jgi:PAS domain-containing protein